MLGSKSQISITKIFWLPIFSWVYLLRILIGDEDEIFITFWYQASWKYWWFSTNFTIALKKSWSYGRFFSLVFFFWQTIGETASLCSFKLFFWVVCNLHCARTVKITVHIFFSVKLFVGSVSLSYFVHWVKLLRCSELHHSTSYSRVLRAFSLKTLLLVLNLLSFSEH